MGECTPPDFTAAVVDDSPLIINWKYMLVINLCVTGTIFAKSVICVEDINTKMDDFKRLCMWMWM